MLSLSLNLSSLSITSLNNHKSPPNKGDIRLNTVFGVCEFKTKTVKQKYYSMRNVSNSSLPN